MTITIGKRVRHTALSKWTRVACLIGASLYLPAMSAYATVTCGVDRGYSPEGSAEQLLLTAIGRARQSIRVAAYTFTAPTVARALIDARRRRVDVAVVADAKESAKRSQQATLDLLVSADIPVRTVSAYQIHHDKYMVFDGAALETGSLNYSTAALRRNSENALLLQCPELARDLLTHWQSRWDQGVAYELSY